MTGVHLQRPVPSPWNPHSHPRVAFLQSAPDRDLQADRLSQRMQALRGPHQAAPARTGMAAEAGSRPDRRLRGLNTPLGGRRHQTGASVVASDTGILGSW